MGFMVGSQSPTVMSRLGLTSLTIHPDCFRDIEWSRSCRRLHKEVERTGVIVSRPHRSCGKENLLLWSTTAIKKKLTAK